MAFQLIRYHGVTNSARFVFLGPNQMMIKAEYDRNPDKISLFAEDKAREILRLVDPQKKYFIFWQFPLKEEHSKLSYAQLQQLCPSLGKQHSTYYKPETIFECRACLKQGYDLYHLLPTERECRDCRDEFEDKNHVKLHMTAHYALAFLEHLFKMIYTLNQARIMHQDFHLSNLIVLPTQKDFEQGMLNYTDDGSNLPRLIDFGQCAFDLGRLDPKFGSGNSKEPSVDEKRQINVLVDLFTTCRHGIAILPRESHGDECDEANWLYEAVHPDEREKIEPILMLFQFIEDPITSLDDLLKIVQSALVDLPSVNEAIAKTG